MRVLLIGMMLLLAGCASRDAERTPAELKARWDAQNIFPADYKGDILAFARTYLNSPQHVRGAQASQPVLKKVGEGDRYIVCLRYREPKTGGGFAAKEGASSFVSGKLDRFFDVPAEVTQLCKDVPLEPFPELEKLKP